MITLIDMNVSHVWLYVKDTDVSIQFYRDTLGLLVAETFPDGALFQAGDILLGVHREEGKRKSQPGNTIVIFKVTDIEKTYQLFRKRDLIFDSTIRDEPYGRIATFRDPDGYVFELVQEPTNLG